MVKKVLAEVGINPDRFDLEWASAAEGPRFVKLITDFTLKTKELGPIGEAEGLTPDELKVRIEKALALMNDRKLRMALGNATKTIRKESIFNQKGINALIDDKLGKSITAGLEGIGVEAVAKN